MKISGLLIDIDGTLLAGNEVIPGAKDTLEYLRGHNIPFRFVTNITRKSRRTVADAITLLGLPIDPSEILTPLVTAAAYLRGIPGARAFLSIPDAAKEEFAEIEQDEANPTHIVFGDIAEGFTFGRMNRLFTYLLNGAELIALQKNRYWKTDKGLTLDAGAYVAALEFATHHMAKVVGKPDQRFFLLAIEALARSTDQSFQPREIAMIGDDIEADIHGAQSAGLRGFLVQTGKFNTEDASTAMFYPDAILHSIADLPAVLSKTHEL